MSKIQLKFDNTLQQSDIIMYLSSSSVDEMGEENYVNNQSEIQQTSVYGIQVPLIMINDIVISYTDIFSFTLESTGRLPEVSLTVRDRYGLISSIDPPGVDNELRIQILPRFEGKYKKINLTFFISDMRIVNEMIHITGYYKLSSLTDTRIKSFGEINTYDLFEKIAIDTGLGFATNIESNDEDKRYVYCSYQSYADVMKKEIFNSGCGNQVLDYWIDFWNNIVLADIYERYFTVEDEQDMKIWVSTQNKEMSEGNVIEPREMTAVLNNHPLYRNSELFVEDYKIINNPGKSIYKGTDEVISVYEENKKEYIDHLIQDGDVQKDIFKRYTYLGELYGNYNYILSREKKESFEKKISTNETIEVTLNTPLLGLMRGDKVNFICYYNDASIDSKINALNNNGVINNDVISNIPIPNDDEYSYNSIDGNFLVDRSISGQYLITGCKIKYRDEKWDYILTLKRSSGEKDKYMKET